MSLSKKDLETITAMFVQLQKVSKPAVEVVAMQASKSDVPNGLLDAARWVVASKDWAKSANAIRFVKHAGVIYFQLMHGTKGLGKNRQLRKSAQGFYSVPFGTHALEGATVVKL